MKILVLGGTGFIGAPLVRRLLARGHRVAVVHRGRIDPPAGAGSIVCARGEWARARDAFGDEGLDAVVDLIAYTEAHARETVEVFADRAERLVVASSADVYLAYGRLRRSEPGPPEPIPLAESARLRERIHPDSGTEAPPDQRDAEKLHVERIFAEAARPSTILRLGMVYGPGDRQRRFWALIRRMLDGRSVLPLESTWARWRGPWCFVEDAADALVRAAVAPAAAGRVYNVAARDAFSWLDCAERLRPILGWTGELRLLDLAGAPPHLRRPAERLDLSQELVLDSSRIRSELGFEEAVDAVSALTATVEAERARWRPSDAQSDPEYIAEDAALASGP